MVHFVDPNPTPDRRQHSPHPLKHPVSRMASSILSVSTHKTAKVLLPSVLLAGVFCLHAPAWAQMVNDPAETIIMNRVSPFSPVRPGEEESQSAAALPNNKPGNNKTDAKGANKEKVEELPDSLQPELDLPALSSDNKPSRAPSDDPIRAKAVMVDINSNTLNYDKDRDVYIATGAVHMVISEQNSELYADKMTYDQNQDLVIAEGTVTIIKDGQKTHGSYAKIDLSRKSALINDYSTSVEKIRIKAKNALINPKYVQYENGRIIIMPGAMQSAMNGTINSSPAKRTDKIAGRVSKDTFVNDEDLAHLADQAITELSDNESELSDAEAVDAESRKSRFALKMGTVDIHRDSNGYNQVIARKASLYFKNRKIYTLPGAEMSFDEPSNTIEYLGPDIGVDPDYGGFFFGPGWDFRAGEHGSVRISPLLSMGGSGRRLRSGSTFERASTGPGIGGIVHFHNPNTRIDLAYNSRVGEPVLLANHKLFDSGKTRLIASMNEDYTSGFIGYERPRYGAMIADSRKVAEFSKFRLDSYSSAGYFKDEFFPTNQQNFFVKAKSPTPVYAGRAQLQAQIRNTEPLLRVGNFLDFGVRGDIALAGYTTGDFVGLIRGGPSMNLRIGNRFYANARYFYAATAGETPFVFDSYYRGRQNVLWSNTFKVNNFLSVGMRSDMSLLRDNATNSLLTGNAFFMLVGPKEFKMNLAYDVIRKRSFFGVNFYPGQGARGVDFDKMRVFQPEDYTNPAAP